MERIRIKYLITNLLTGFPSIAERKEIEQWAKSDEAEQDSCEAWDAADDNIENSLKNSMWNALQQQISESKPETTEKLSNDNKKYIVTRRWSYTMLKVVASVALILCSALTLYLVYGMGSYEAKTNGNNFCFEVAEGQKGTLKLDDGTVVYLNSASKITYSSDYNVTDRKINLVGEAYFDVAKNPNKKFIVSCNGIEVEALGTEFNVKAYSTDSIVTTTLAEGKVQVSSENESITLLPNDVATYNVKRNSMSHSTVDDMAVADYWRKGHLVFNGETLSSIANTIERMYSVHIEIKDEQLRQMRFTGTIQNNSLNNIMHVISQCYPLSYSMTDSQIVISPLKD